MNKKVYDILFTKFYQFPPKLNFKHRLKILDLFPIKVFWIFPFNPLENTNREPPTAVYSVILSRGKDS